MAVIFAPKILRFLEKSCLSGFQHKRTLKLDLLKIEIANNFEKMSNLKIETANNSGSTEPG